jgi:hypothetical protein
MEEIKKNIAQIKESQIRMEMDFQHHIKRTSLLESKLEKQLDPVYRAYSGLKWGSGFVIGLAVFLGSVLRINGLF